MSDATAPLDESAFEATLEIETPERVRIRYELAGPGSRFAAGTVDVLLIGFLTLVAVLAVALAVEVTVSDLTQRGQMLGMALAGIVMVVVWAYYLGFELLWSGQTPGKRVMGLRVVSATGGPAPAAAIVVRNVLRIVDGLPLIVVEVLGGIAMFASRRAQRIGDLAAGTVVVQERELELSLDRVARGGTSLADGSLSSDDRARAKRFLARRKELRADRRDEIARALVDDLRTRYDLPQADPEALLSLLAAGRRPADLRDLAGPAVPTEAPPAAGESAAPPRDATGTGA